MMRFSRNIAISGTKAVCSYRRIAGIENDNELPEIFLGSWIARSLHDDFQVNARVECSFTRMAQDLGLDVDSELKRIMGSWRADVAIYEEGRPTAVIEIKVFDEGCRAQSVLRDLRKMRKLSSRTGIETYLAVLITSTSGATCETRVRSLSNFLGHDFDYIDSPIVAGDGSADWSWRFACGAFL
ncbi:hypothetical protein JK217_13335 [Gluconobacter kondonii]|uniref:hypothetical protein n=1 Tax=Gluconobacter kondonii TaxID=941463 RepID=UPI001B8ADFE9|nr:hypothetical protein [Gluconobacter kondonii]MBS1078714.1 hypothetical protein [Gluconobacter kondonii]